MVDLTVDYLGMTLRSPLVASASPATADVDGLRRLEDAGCAAVVLPSLFEEEIEHYALEVDRILMTGADSHTEAHSYFPDLYEYYTGPERYLDLVERAKRAVSIPVIPSLNGVTTGWWTEFARHLQDAGADAIELNEYVVAADPNLSSASVEERYLDLVREVEATVDIPFAVKIGPFFSSFGNMAGQLVAAGADGLVLFNRFFQPDIDLDTLSVEPHLTLSDSEDLRLPLRWIALLRRRIEASLAASSGIHTVEDVLKALLAGADVTMMASALLRHGADHIQGVERALVGWLEDHGYTSVRLLQGSVCADAAADPSAYERANYLQTLRSYSSDRI
ncbi:MAG: dihydroorotate dehydrogenase-like protein [Acidimicrobiia bacterium]|nr:dihydroorotate dehydrogenase-like protein [Acidimicrobiia bacterium]